MQDSKNIAVVGSGLVGSLLAILLKNKGHRVSVFDRRPDIREVTFSGRSINLAISNRGWKTLREMGIEEGVRELSIPLYKRAMHVAGKPLYFQDYGKAGEAIYSIPRGLLNRKMIDLAEEAGVSFQFEEKVWDVDLSTASIFTGKSEKGEWQEKKYDLVFGADGAFSRVRHKMQRQSRFNLSQEFIEVGYKELHIPAGKDGKHKLDKNSFHIWPRGNFMLIAMPNLDGSFTCTLFMPFEGKNSFESITTEREAEAFFQKHFPDITEEIQDLTEDFFKNPTSALVTIKCFPWTSTDKVALIGDAAHAVVPFFGQGMNAGFEDISVMKKLMEDHGNDWEKIFSVYQERRKPNTDAIADLSLRNYKEMSSKTADQNFLLRKKIEKRFSEKHPEKWIPAYSRVTFSEEPYAKALKIGDQQALIMDEVMQMKDINTKWDSVEVEEKILHLLEREEAVVL